MARDKDRDMERPHLHLSVSRSVIWLLLVLLQTSTAQRCDVQSPVNFAENNEVGDVVATISLESGETVEITSTGLPFGIQGNQLIATQVLDHEEAQNYAVSISCKGASGTVTKTVVVIIGNENDNPPIFDQPLYTASANEMSPIDTSVGNFAATDRDGTPIYYRLRPASDSFKLRSESIPDILVNTQLDYDTVKRVEVILEAQDTQLSSAEEPSFTATATIIISIIDIDNRPPWFEPCTKHNQGGVVVCENTGYTGKITLNEQQTGVLSLDPGPVQAIDGDLGINVEITYSFLTGNEDGLFEINSNTGSITMVKAADVLGPITLTVLAAQKINPHQFATTSVTISVLVKSLHAPKFQKPQYEGLIASVGSMALDLTNKDQPLQILATDQDYSGTGGLNPHITYSVEGSSDFAIVGGYLFLTKDLPEGSFALQVVATDTSNDETATAALRVELTICVKGRCDSSRYASKCALLPGLSTTTLSQSTTDFMSTTSIESSTSDSKTTTEMTPTSEIAGMSADISATMFTTSPTEGTFSMTVRSGGHVFLATDFLCLYITTTSGIQRRIKNTTDPWKDDLGSIKVKWQSGLNMNSFIFNLIVDASGVFKVMDMAALGATLGVLLFACLLVIGFLVYRMRKGDAAWKKIQEASVFRSSLSQGPGDQKEGIQYINEAFQKDNDDRSSTSSGGSQEKSITISGEPQKPVGAISPKESIWNDSAPPRSPLSETSSDAVSYRSDDEKEVKPILTKERRAEEGYKSVWFKEDIDPNAKEEVVIIPENRDEESEEEDEEPSSSRRKNESDHFQPKSPKVFFADTDMDSGLGVKFDDPADDSESDDDIKTDL
ncbi:uncharacterized protein V3H82_018718 [Fundulus diaphanus]